LKAAQMIDELNKKGYFEKGAVALSHTESQQDFLQGKAAMIPCGTWLESEMKNVMPPGAKMAFFLPPAVTGGKGDPSSLIIAIEPWMVPKDAKNPNGAVALFKYMTSLDKAKEFVEKKGSLMAIKGSLTEASLPDVLQLLAMGKKTGCLSVTHRNNFGSIYFDKGKICYAAIVNRRDRLGALWLGVGLAVALSLAAALPASVGYVSPSDSKLQQALTVGVP